MIRKVSLVLSHWYTLIEGLQESSMQFYDSLEDALKQRKIPNIEISRLSYREGGVISAKRVYFRVYRKGYLFDICAAHFGNGFFISWWLSESPSLFLRFILKIPLLGRLWVWLFYSQTYYRIDTALMFQESVRSAILEVIDEITKAKGLRALSEDERKPIHAELFKR